MNTETQRRLLESTLDLVSSMRSARLPSEIRELIMNYAMPPSAAPYRASSYSTSLLPSAALIPPSNGLCALNRLPAELTRSIFASSLPSRDVVHHPTCTCDSKSMSSSKNDPTLGPRRNRISDLMTLNKKLKSEISEVLYEERSFVIHLHEGLSDGGIEFLDSGRQPLQYMDEVDDQRFYKFRIGDEFGFQRLKKIIVQIYPLTTEDSRHTAINTYFMNEALCRLLERSAGKNSEHGITSIKIEFPKATVPKAAVGRAAIQRSEHYWWDPDRKEPRATSVHLLSNIRLVLEPFAMLTGCSKVHIALPTQLTSHQPTMDFVTRLQASMMSRHGTIFLDDDVARHIEAARYAMEDYVNWTLHGRSHVDVKKLNESDMQEDDPVYISDDEDSDDGKGCFKSRKHDLSPASKAHVDWGRKPWESHEEWVEQQRAMMNSLLSARKQEDRMVEELMGASQNNAAMDETLDQPWPRLSARPPQSRQTRASKNRIASSDIFGPPLDTPSSQGPPRKRRKLTFAVDAPTGWPVAPWEFSSIDGVGSMPVPTSYPALQRDRNSMEGLQEDYYTSGNYIFTTFGKESGNKREPSIRDGASDKVLEANLPIRSFSSQPYGAPQPELGFNSRSNL